MSVAFDRAMGEIDRIWDASDKFDTKVLNFTSIVSAGALAAAALAVKEMPLPRTLLPWESALVALGVASLVAFIGLALGSASPVDFAAPLDPAKLAQAPHHLTNDAGFELAMLPVMADAYKKCHESQQGKARLFSWSLWPLRLSVLCLALAIASYLLIPSPKGATDMSDNKPSTTPVTTPVTTPPTKPDSTPALGPVIVAKGQPGPKSPTSNPPRHTP